MYIYHVRYRVPNNRGQYNIHVEVFTDNESAISRYYDLCEYTKYSAITVKRLKK